MHVSKPRKHYRPPEDFYLPSISITSFIGANGAFYPKFDRQLMNRLLQEFELALDTSIQALSYGQKKKFFISFALATKCRLLVLDEPTNGLDIPSKALFWVYTLIVSLCLLIFVPSVRELATDLGVNPNTEHRYAHI